MGRNSKKGLLYFPVDVDIFEDDKLFDVQNEYGPLGEVIYLRLLCLIYKNGYYYRYDSIDKLAKMLIRSIGNKWTRDKQVVVQVIPFLAKINLFSAELMQENVLTSASIQRQYLKCVERRQPLNEYPYWLLEKKPSFAVSSNQISVYKKRISVYRNKENAYSGTQSKEKKIKENKTTTTPYNPPSGDGSSGGNPFAGLVHLWENINARPLTGYEGEKIQDLLEIFSETWIEEAMKVAADAGKRKLNYVEGILNRWQAEGRDGGKKGRETFLDIAKRLEAERKAAQQDEHTRNGVAIGQPASDIPGNTDRGGQPKTMAALIGTLELPGYPKGSDGV